MENVRYCNESTNSGNLRLLVFIYAPANHSQRKLEANNVENSMCTIRPLVRGCKSEIRDFVRKYGISALQFYWPSMWLL